MKQHSVRELYKHLSKHLKDLPFEITNHNKVVAIVTSPEKILEKEIIPEVVPDLPLPKVFHNPPKIEIKPEEDPTDLGRCAVPGCPMKGPKRYDWKAYNPDLGEVQPIPAYACKKHYLAFLKVKDTL